MEGEHLGEFALKALDPNNRPTPRALGIAVGDEVEAVLARAVALDPKQRPRDAGELWGMLKHAIGVDERSGRQAARPPAAAACRRRRRRTRSASPSASPRAPPRPSSRSADDERASARGQRASPHGSTLRMAGAPRSGTQALADAARAAPPASTRAHLRATVPMQHRRTQSRDVVVHAHRDAPSGATWRRHRRGGRRPPRSRTPVALLVVLAIVVLGALAARRVAARRARAPRRLLAAPTLVVLRWRGDPFGLPGQLLDGQYRVERAIGEGGFSVVYRGMHLGLGEPIAIKCLKLNASLDTESIENFTRRFRDEGRLLYRLGQGNLDIVRVIISGTTVSPTTGALVPYMVLEWLEGMSLAADFKARRAREAARAGPSRRWSRSSSRAALALDHAHRQGVVHRDVKPGNLFLAASRDVRHCA